MRDCLVLLFLLALASEATGQGTVSERVASGASQFPWRLDAEWRVGTWDGDDDHTFGHVTNVRIAPNGQVFIADFQSQDLRVFSRDGEFVRRIGRQGRGPGEFEGPVGVAWDVHGRMWVADAFNHRYSVFEPGGELVFTRRRPIAAVARWGQELLFDAEGYLLDELAWSTANGLSTGFVQVDTAGTIVDTFPPLPAMPHASPVRTEADVIRIGEAVRAVRAYMPRSVYTLAADGTLWFARWDEFRLIHRAMNGDTLQVIESDHRSSALTPADRSTIADALRGTGLSAEELGLRRPIIQALHVLEDGYVLVRIEEEPGEDSGLFDVFAPDGRFVGSVRAAYPLAQDANAAIRGDRLVGVTRDSLDVNYVVSYRISRSQQPRSRQ